MRSQFSHGTRSDFPTGGRRSVRGPRRTTRTVGFAFLATWPFAVRPLAVRPLAVWLLSVWLASTATAAHVLHVVPESAPAFDPRDVPPGDTPAPEGSRAHPIRGLEAAAARARAISLSGTDESVVLRLGPGRYRLTPTPLVEPTCGNCEDPNTPVPITVGAVVSGNRIQIVGAPEYTSVIETRSGYGLLFEECWECVLHGVVVTGGERDTSGMATDAAVVVKQSSVRIEDNWIRDNIGDPETIETVIVGIMGVTGREGSRIELLGNRIHRNSWDGVALYRDARANILGNEIDGVDLALGRRAGGGRGVGIGLTWNAQAEVRGNRVARYWKGIGVFVDAQAVVEENVVEQIATWGLSLWDAGRGRPRAVFRGNAVDSTGACGVSIVRSEDAPPEAGMLSGNLFSRTGQNPKYDDGEPYCFQMAIALHAVPEDFPIRGNMLFDNREPDGRPGSGDVSRDAFLEAARSVCAGLSRWPAARGSDFFQRHARALGESFPSSGPDPRGWGRPR